MDATHSKLPDEIDAVRASLRRFDFKFFHVSDMSGDVEPAAGDAVTYALGADRNGNA
jgi:hypothetical protein